MSEQKIINGDCLEVMKTFPDKSFDLVLTDPPYGTTAQDWDIPLDWMGEALRVVRDDGAVISFSAQPYTSDLIQSFRKQYRHAWIWNKKLAGNAMLSNTQPLKIHEDILVFGKKTPRYFPIMTKGAWRRKLTNTKWKSTFGEIESEQTANDDYKPTSILTFHLVRTGRVHPTQKPVELLVYLLQTYSKESDSILDPFMGSGTTLVAAKQLNRNATGIEISPEYCEIARKRLEQDLLF